MKHDISRNTFDPRKHFSRVLKQQGRVDVDAEWNEHSSILLHYLRTLATDLIGPHAGPEKQCGFQIIDTAVATAGKIEPLKGADFKKAGFFIGPGRYYVDGLLCENEGYAGFFEQKDRPFLKEELTVKAGPYVAYLDVWERLVTAAEDTDIREVALGGADTATRARVVWQVKLRPAKGTTPANADDALAELARAELPRLRARLQPQEASTDACIQSPDSRYRGAENQLYRVEIHAVAPDGTATFKWSRENGSVVFPVVAAPASDGTHTTVRLAHLGRDRQLGLTEGDWVELADDDSVMREESEPLLRVHRLLPEESTVILLGAGGGRIDPKKHGLLRRWDRRALDKTELKDGVRAAVVEADAEHDWLPLEDGVEVQFTLPAKAEFRSGDYWLIPARVREPDGVIEWPQESDGKTPEARPPRGIIHHYAPLATVTVVGDAITFAADCRSAFAPTLLGSPIAPALLEIARAQPE